MRPPCVMANRLSIAQSKRFECLVQVATKFYNKYSLDYICPQDSIKVNGHLVGDGP